ncbi:MAG: hypothetical protein ABIF85_02610 [Nanoarchaeota archaeon]
MRFSNDELFSMSNCLTLIKNSDDFKTWLNKQHKINNFSEFFHGYKFMIETILRTLIHSIESDYSLGIEEDYVFYRARHKGIALSKVYNTCDKIIFLKNLSVLLRNIKKSKDWSELSKQITILDRHLLKPFHKILEDKVSINPKIKNSKKNVLNKITMFYTSIYFNDLEWSIPKGYRSASLLDNKVDKKIFEKSFKGYKYALQYLWSILLGKNFRNSVAKNMHLSKVWKTKYAFGEEIPTGDKRLDLDSYFTKMNEEIITPMERELNVSIAMDELFYIHLKILPKKRLKYFFRTVKEPALNQIEELDYVLYWYPIDILDTLKIYSFNGVPAFISTLLGVLRFRAMKGIKEKTTICRFIHPDKSVKGNDYSYGVLIQVYGSLGISDSSGWILSYDCCTDYSGNGGIEHELAERIIKENTAHIEIRELVVTKEAFLKYLADTSISTNKGSFYELEKKTQQSFESSILSEAKGLIMELITYYTLSKENSSVDWDLKDHGEQLDIKATTEKEVVLIECKLDSSTINIRSECENLLKKIKKISTDKEKRCELWFWEPPTRKTYKEIAKYGIPIKILSELIETNSHWKEKDKDRIKTIFKKYRPIINKSGDHSFY